MKKDKKAKNEKQLSPFSKKKIEEMKQYKEHTKHTQVMELGEHVSLKIRLQETIFADREAEIGVDVRKWLNDKYPFKGGIQGILISKDKWLEFMQKATEFTMSVFGKEIFYNEPQSAPIQHEQVVVKSKTSIPSIQKPDNQSISETNWDTVIRQGKKIRDKQNISN